MNSILHDSNMFLTFSNLEEHDDMDSINKNMTKMVQQSAMSIAKKTRNKNAENIIAYKSSAE